MTKHKCDDKCNPVCTEYNPVKRVKALPVLPKKPKVEITELPLLNQIDFAGDLSSNNLEFAHDTTSDTTLTITGSTELPNTWMAVAGAEIDKQIKAAEDDVLRIAQANEKIQLSKNEVAITEANAILRSCKAKLQSIIRDKKL